MILISFNGAVNVDNFKIYEEIFNEKNAINPNNCTAKGTFFVSHKYTNYSAVQVMLDFVIFFNLAFAERGADTFTTFSGELNYTRV